VTSLSSVSNCLTLVAKGVKVEREMLEEPYDKSKMKNRGISASAIEFVDLCLSPDPAKRATVDDLQKSKWMTH